MKFGDIIESRLHQSLPVKDKMFRSPEILKSINEAVKLILKSYKENSGRVSFAGNGGSAAELVSRYYLIICEIVEKEMFPNV